MTNTHTINPVFIAEIREQMLAFAKSQLQDPHLAEDAVQEALLSALSYSDQFKGNSALKSWVFAILKNKIIDIFRHNKRYVTASTLENSPLTATSQQDAELFDTLFDRAGHWHADTKPADFLNPEKSYENEAFWLILEICLTNLPAEQARIFLMREYLGLATEEICQQTELTSNHYYVVMHRAKLKLQSCLSIKWFNV